MPKKEAKKIVQEKKKRERKMSEGKTDRVRRRKHKSVALLGRMLTPVRDY